MTKELNNKRVNPPFWQHDYHVLKRLYILLRKIAHDFVNQGNVIIDYGCGTLPYKNLFPIQKVKYIGVDIGKNKYADIWIKENENIPLSMDSADIVLSTQVLEHVNDMPFYLHECYRLVKKKGILIISTHGVWPYHPYPADYNRFTREGLINILINNGFKPINVYPILGPFATITQYTLLLLGERLSQGIIFSKLLLAFLSIVGNVIIYIEDKMFPPTKNSDASVFLICARKI